MSEKINSSNELDIVTLDPNKRLGYVGLTGRFKRKLHRNNTVHLTAVCPKCGHKRIRWHKSISLRDNKTTIYNVWVCPKCYRYFKREELENVRYE